MGTAGSTSQRIDATAGSLELPRARQAGQYYGGYTQCRHVARAEQSPPPREVQYRALMRRSGVRFHGR